MDVLDRNYSVTVTHISDLTLICYFSISFITLVTNLSSTIFPANGSIYMHYQVMHLHYCIQITKEDKQEMDHSLSRGY